MDNFQLDLGSDKDRWERLLNEIEAGNVVPVIGPDLLVNPHYVKNTNETPFAENIHQQLISYIASQTGVTSFPRTFSQLVFDENYKRHVRDKDKIYNLIYQVLTNIDLIKEINGEPSDLLMDLLGTKKFPFVITTSFTPIVENAMKSIWGEVRVLTFNNDPQGSAWETGGDIRTPKDLNYPSVYYMFGNACSKRKDARFVVTDSDMMTFCGSWIRGTGVPRTLTEALKNKYLLILGNNYSDWLFRFIWSALRTNTIDMKSDVIVNNNAEETFKQFLERLEIFFQESPEEVITRIKNEMQQRNSESTQSRSLYETDVFISYSHSDRSIAQKLYDRLRENGISVWFDDYSIPRGEGWEAKIQDGINHSRLFVPILSRNVEQESIVPHEYRTEWNIAAKLSLKIGGKKFIMPFAENGFDFYNNLTKLPGEFVEKNATWYTANSDLDEITQVLLDAIEDVKALENKMFN